KPVYLMVNKVDNHHRSMEPTEFYSMGFENIFFVSSISGSGTGEILDAVTANIPEEESLSSIDDEEKDLPKFAIIGQPNVGKSSLLNALIGTERTIVSNIAGTTRDTIHTRYKLFQKDFILIDTAGLRRKTKVHENLEFYSVIRAIRAMDDADVCLLVLDATQDMTAQDLNIFSLAARKGKGIVLLVNKWDLITDKQTNTARDYEKAIKKRIAPFSDVPVLFISATGKTRIYQAVEKALEVYENRKRRIPTAELNEVMQEALKAYQPPVVRGNPIKIKYVMQLPNTSVPSFAFYANFPDEIKEPYKNYLENKLR